MANIYDYVKKQVSNEESVVMLSSGIDSMLVALIMQKEGIPFEAINVSYGDDNLEYCVSRDFALKHGIKYKNIQLTDQDIKKFAQYSIKKLGVTEPWSIAAAIPYAAVYDLLKTRGKLVPIVTGGGADVILGGGETDLENIKKIITKNKEKYFGTRKLTPNFFQDILENNHGLVNHVFGTQEFVELCEHYTKEDLFGYADHDFDNDNCEIYGIDDSSFAGDDDCLVDKRPLRELGVKLGMEPIDAYQVKRPLQVSSGVFNGLNQLARSLANENKPEESLYSSPLQENDFQLSARLGLQFLEKM